MPRLSIPLLPAVLLFATHASAQQLPTEIPLPDCRQLVQPLNLTLEPQEPSVYALPTPAKPDEGINMGGVHLDIKVSYFTDYIYRGIDVTRFIGEVSGKKSGENANFQFDGKLSFDLGKLPSPFIAVFTNVLDQDPISTFQEVRPSFGVDWKIRPVIISLGNNVYQYPNRSEFNTGEMWAKVVVDDAAVLRNPDPLLSPYFYAAYDYDNYNGWYFEGGISHDFVIEGTGLTITALADVAFVNGHGAFAGSTGKDTGLQHYDLGVAAKYSLNQLLNFSTRYGSWSLNGYLFYTDGLNDKLRSDTQLWGGAGIEFRY